ncbi:MAG: SEC-C metal-binding domain-containing protein [Bryobacteraceae bacterium]|nr:SEC-C metal-binding domain-containing protein [Bryobacteraceae bacterium]
MLTPDKFAAAPVSDLLAAAGQGRVGMDHRWLNAILDRGQAAVPDLVRFGLEKHEEDALNIDDQILLILTKIGSPEAVPFIVRYLRDNSGDLPDYAIDAILPLKADLLDPLVELYEEMSEDDASEVAFALAAFQIRDERVLKLLLDRLEYDAGDGALCLGLYGDPAATGMLEALLLEVEDEHLKSDIGDALEQLGREVDATVTPLDILEFFPEQSGPEYSVLDEPDLLEMLDSEDEEYRLAAISGFVNRDMTSTAVQKLLQAAQSHGDERVRAKSWEALGSEVADNDDVYQAMLNTLQDESASMTERAGALVGLGQRAEEESIRTYAERFYENEATRAAALSAMWNSLDRSFAKYFPPHLADPDPEIRKHAISGIGYLGIHDSAEKLRDYFADEDYRANALFAYALAVRAEISPGRVRPLLRRIDEAAGGLTEEENELVEIALDERLMLQGHKPVFHPDNHQHVHGPDCDHDHDEDEEVDDDAPAVAAPAAVAVAGPAKPGRNEPCPCGSGKKYKKCHGAA